MQDRFARLRPKAVIVVCANRHEYDVNGKGVARRCPLDGLELKPKEEQK